MGFPSFRRTAAAASLAAAIISVPSFMFAQAVVRGVLYDDATGTPVRGSVMLIDPATDAPVAHTPTDSLGNFSRHARDGRYQIAAVRPGWKSIVSAPVPLANGERLTIRVPIAETSDPVHKIGVVEHIRPEASAAASEDPSRRAMASTGFAGRKALGQGMQYDRSRLERSGVATLGQFLRSVPGLVVLDPGSTSSMQMTRNSAAAGDVGLRGQTGAACHVGWFLDGHRVDLPGRTDPLTDGLGALQLETLEAVEVFRGVSELPAEFAAPDIRCGAIALWSRRG